SASPSFGRELPNTVMILSEFKFLLFALATGGGLAAKFLNHCRTQRVQCFRGFMPFAAHVVAHKRKNQPPSIWQFRIAGARAHMVEGPGLCMIPQLRARILEACSERPAPPCRGQQIKKRGEPLL